MANIDADLEDQHSKGVFATLMADGKWMYQAGEYKKAIDSFTEVSVKCRRYLFSDFFLSTLEMAHFFSLFRHWL